MKVSQKCPKCPGVLKEFHSKSGATFNGCPVCKGIWVKISMMPKIFGSAQAQTVLESHGLAKSMSTNFECPNCGDFLQTGFIGASDLAIDACLRCHSYFFDDQ